MRLLVNRLLWVVVFALSITGCSTVPSVKAWRPWYRTFGEAEKVKTGTKIVIEIKGENKVLAGNDGFEKSSIRAIIENYLARRGYEVVQDENYDYKILFVYGITRNDKLITTSEYYNNSFNSYYAGAVGVSTAYLVSMQSSGVNTTTSTNTNYSHVNTFEIYAKNNKLAWKADAVWDDSDIGIYPNYNNAIMILMSYLPRNKSLIPQVKEVNDSHAINYYNVYCLGWLNSPAVPYRISFEYMNTQNTYLASRLPMSIKNNNILAACVDLIQTSEIALPVGGFADYSNPLNPHLWGKLQLGGQYLLGPSKKQTNILMELSGNRDGYLVDSCEIASDKEFQKYNNQLEGWWKSLETFYNFYEK